jgi:hypothetical protein
VVLAVAVLVVMVVKAAVSQAQVQVVEQVSMVEVVVLRLLYRILNNLNF